MELTANFVADMENRTGHSAKDDAKKADVLKTQTPLPGFHPPTCRKRDLCRHGVFKKIDDHVDSVAIKENTSLKDLAAELTKNAMKVSELRIPWVIFFHLAAVIYKEMNGPTVTFETPRGNSSTYVNDNDRKHFRWRRSAPSTKWSSTDSASSAPVCGQHLTVKTYYTNQLEFGDKEVYCCTHTPRTALRGFDADAVGIQNALRTSNLLQPFAKPILPTGHAPLISNEAIAITHPMNAQNQFKTRHKLANDRHHYPAFVAKSKSKIIKAQTELEKVQRKEEDVLMEVFRAERTEEKKKIDKEIDEEWEERLKELTANFDADLVKRTTGHKAKDDDKNANSLNFAEKKKHLKENLTVKSRQKEEASTLRLRKKEQEDTVVMVQKHSEQMLNLLKKKQQEIRQEIVEEIVFIILIIAITIAIVIVCTITTITNIIIIIITITTTTITNIIIIITITAITNIVIAIAIAIVTVNVIIITIIMSPRERKDMADGDGEAVDTAVILEEVTIVPVELPEFHPPNCRKRDLYYDAAVFKDLDEYVFSVAEKDQSTFTDLVAELTTNCVTDLEKARAIFRWITVKDLNVLEFEEGLEKNTPMGLLRGIKYGTETYHTLFMRLCSYAGLPCVEIKGHGKGVGYEPGMKIQEHRFRNTWNAVLIAGNWWPVQCQCAARKVTLDMRAHVGPVTKDTWREHMHYAYDDFYFLTDPDEFIYQLRADDRRMQLLWTPISLEQFERTPYVYSGFFNNGLEFDRPMQAVLHTDNTGIAEVKLRGWNDLAKDTAFAYELWFADRERSNDAEFHGTKLQRFVLHSILDGQAMFRVQVPTPGSYVLRLSIEENDETKKTRLLHFLCAFKVVCQTLACDVHALPSCASGEWGPSMGERHFGLKAMTHITGVVSVDNDLEMKFGLPRKLHFLCKLRMNGVEDSTLEKFVSFSVCDDVLTVKVNPPQAGQYGLDFYAKPKDVDHDTFVHMCQYLLNVTRVIDTITIPHCRVRKHINGDRKSSSNRLGCGPCHTRTRPSIKQTRASL
ncbi:Hillarin [Lamellibrachia satsuma]|nr:Hillarin [Lamellibrachia satsuma]